MLDSSKVARNLGVRCLLEESRWVFRERFKVIKLRELTGNCLWIVEQDRERKIGVGEERKGEERRERDGENLQDNKASVKKILFITAFSGKSCPLRKSRECLVSQAFNLYIFWRKVDRKTLAASGRLLCRTTLDYHQRVKYPLSRKQYIRPHL